MRAPPAALTKPSPGGKVARLSLRRIEGRMRGGVQLDAE